MHWLYLLASLFCMALTLRAGLPGWIVAILLLLALGLLVAWMLGWAAARLSGVSRSEAAIISVEELRRLRTEAEARTAADPPRDASES